MGGGGGDQQCGGVMQTDVKWTDLYSPEVDYFPITIHPDLFYSTISDSPTVTFFINKIWLNVYI